MVEVCWSYIELIDRGGGSIYVQFIDLISGSNGRSVLVLFMDLQTVATSDSGDFTQLRGAMLRESGCCGGEDVPERQPLGSR